MTINLKKLAGALFMAGTVTAGNASVCNSLPGTVVCGPGTVDSLSGNGMVTVNRTRVLGATDINGQLDANEAKFFSLEVNGSVKLNQCIIKDAASVRGSLTASSTKFAKTLELFSSETRFIKSKLSSSLHLGHTNTRKQVVYLENFSEVSGDIIFDDGDGKVFVSGDSRIGGKIIGGRAISK